MSRMLVVVAVVVLAMSLAASVGASERKPAPRFGMNHEFVWTPDADIPGLIQALKDAHVQIVRVPLRWTVVEPEKGKWDFAKVDRVVHDLRAARIEVLATLMGVPSWASGVKPGEIEGFWDCSPPENEEDYANYVRTCVNRYKKDTRYWEIWNEENGPDFYKPMPDSGEYVWLLKSAYKTIKSADKTATVVLGGLQMNGVIANPWLPTKIHNFLQKIYWAGGKPYFDVVNIHPYVLATKEQGPEYCAKLVKDAVEVMKRNGDGAKPLWITETGVFTGQGVTEEMQADHLRGVYRELSKIPAVKAIYWFTLRDYPSAICGGEDTMGMVATDGRRKPVFQAYKEIATKQ